MRSTNTHRNASSSSTVDAAAAKAAAVHEGDAHVSRNTPFLDRMRTFHGKTSSDITYDPCITQYTPTYMRRDDVLKALHADSHPNPRWPGDRPGK